MAIDLYMVETSLFCRTVVIVAKHLGIEINKKMVSVMQQEHLKPEFLKMNPQHCVPTIDDNGFILWESRAIITYLVNKYDPDNKLYPRDPQKRAVIDRLLYFDHGTFCKDSIDCFYSPIITGVEFNPEKEKALKNDLNFLEGCLEDSLYLTGDHLTLADYSISSTLTIHELINYDLSDFPKLLKWISRLKALPYYDEVHSEGMKQGIILLEMRKKANQNQQ